MSEYIDDEHHADENEHPQSTRETRDPGGVPQALMAPGFRSVSPLVGFGISAVLLLVIGSVVWSVAMHPRPSLAATLPRSQSQTQDVVNAKSIVPDPTDPPLQAAPRTRPVISIPTPASANASSGPVTTAAMQSAGPSGETQGQIAAADDARRLIEASYASSHMQLDGQGNQTSQSVNAPLESTPVQDSETSRDQRVVASSASNNDLGGAHAAFTSQRSGPPGYEHETSAYELDTGTIIPARLITAIDSTVPGGLIKAEIIEPIFDSKTHSVVVLPQGTIAIGYADSALYGEARLVAAWTEFYLPNGRKFFASNNQGSGAKGEAGMPASVDTHAGRAFGNALVGAVLQAGVNFASRATTIDISNASAVAQPQRQAPTLHVYPGQLFNIVLNHDLPLDRYDENAP